MVQLTLNVLGTLTLVSDDQPLTPNFRSDKVRALLVYLALEAGTPHQRSTLITLLWPEFSKSAGLANLRKTLFYLRGTLDEIAAGTSQSLLTIDRQTVQFTPTNFTVDAIQFEQLLAEVAQHSHSHLHNCVDCLACLKQAELLFRGELLPGFGLADATMFEEWLLFKREQLQQQAILVLQHLSAIYEQKSNYERVEKYANRLLLLDPYHEKAIRQLMRALTKTDRRSGALQIYDRLADRLQADIGVLPQERTSQLYQQISEGMLFEPTKIAPKLHHFPIQFTPFLGRKDDLAQVTNLILNEGRRMLTIVGAGGIGKTRLAIEVAKQAVNNTRFVDGIYYIHLSAVVDGEDLPATIATTLSLVPRTNTPLLNQILDFLKEKKCLLLMDNFEHLVGHEAFIVKLLTAAPELAVLVTSRQPLYLHGEQQVRLDGLAYPKDWGDEQETNLTIQIEAFDAVRFFVQSARLVQPDFAISPTNRSAIVHVCHLTQGSPLALEIAANWVRIMNVATIAETIRGSIDFLASPIQNIPNRHRSISRVFDYSWHLLTPHEQLTLAKASIFLEPFKLATAVAVLETTANEIAMLLDKSLLQSPAVGSYRLHELLRQYAMSKLQEMEDGKTIETSTRSKHSDHYLAFVTKSAINFYRGKPKVVASAIRARIGNVTQAWLWAIEHCEQPKQQRMIQQSADGLGRYYGFWGLLEEGDRIFRKAVEQVKTLVQNGLNVEASTMILFSHLLNWQAHFQSRLGNMDTAVQIAENSLLQAKNYPVAAAKAKSLLGRLLLHTGQLERAKNYLQDSLFFYEENNDKEGKAETLDRLGAIQWRQGHHSEALESFMPALAIQKVLGNKVAIGSLCNNIAGVYFERGNLELAHEYTQQARTVFKEMNDEVGVSRLDGRLAVLYEKEGKYDQAIAYNDRALAGHKRFESKGEIVTTLFNKAECYKQQGKYDAAMACYLEGLVLVQDLGMSWYYALFQADIAFVSYRQGNDEKALTLYEEALPVLREAGAKLYTIKPLLTQGEIFLEKGYLSEAQASLQEGLVVAENVGIKESILEARILIIRLDFLRGDMEQAQHEMLALLTNVEEEIEQAMVHYELWRMDVGKDHGRAACELYQRQYKRLPRYDFRRRLDELRQRDEVFTKG
jgi:predicted ATPase/DNA-binding SARP family transcriptional activator